MNEPLAITVLATVDKLREPLALDRWQLHFVAGENEEDDAVASCNAMPEYREATLRFDFDALKTGDDLDEFIVHEMSHCHTWPLHAVADSLATTLAGDNEFLAKHLAEQVREAAERVTTDVGQTYLRLLRRAGILAPPAVS